MNCLTFGRLIAGSLCVLGMVACSEPPPPGPPVVNPRLTRRVFIDVNRASLSTVLEQVARAADSHASFDWSDKRLQRDVTLRLWNVTAQTALNGICESAGCRWQLDGASIKVVATTEPPPVPGHQRFLQAFQVPMVGSRTYKQVPLNVVLAEIGHYADIGIEIEGKGADTPVTVDVSDLSPLRAVWKVLDAADKASGTHWRSAIRITGTGVPSPPPPRGTTPRAEGPEKVWLRFTQEPKTR